MLLSILVSTHILFPTKNHDFIVYYDLVALPKHCQSKQDFRVWLDWSLDSIEILVYKSLLLLVFVQNCLLELKHYT